MLSHAGTNGGSVRPVLRGLRVGSTLSKKQLRPPGESRKNEGARYWFSDGMAAFAGAINAGTFAYRRSYSTLVERTGNASVSRVERSKR